MSNQAVKLTALTDKIAIDSLLATAEVIGKVGRSILDLKQLTTPQEATAGEIFGEGAIKKIVPDGTKVGRSPLPGQTGIDDLYAVSRPDVDCVVIEYKFDTSQLKNTLDGKQMSDSWLQGNNTGYNRILEAVNNEQVEAAKINKALLSNKIEKWEVRTRADGSTEIKILDAAGNAKDIDASKILIGKK